MSKFELRKQDLINNPTPRVPVCLCLDISPSMSGRPEWGAAPGIVGVPIDELNEGVKIFYDVVKKDSRSKYAAEIAIVAFSGASYVVRDFEPIIDAEAPLLELDSETGGTSIGSAVEKCLEILDNRKQEYKDAGVEYYQPWLVLMTDGRPTDTSHLKAGPEVSRRVKEGKLLVIAVGIGSKADMKLLEMISPTYPPFKLKGLKFAEFFRFLGQSIEQVPRSQLGESFEIDLSEIKGWNEPL